MGDHTAGTIGIDVSGSHLDAHRLPDGASARFPNTASGIEALARWAGDSVSRVVYEATGRLHRPLETALRGRLPLSRVNPLRARRFGQALGMKAKTDRVDALLLATMGAVLELRLVAASTPSQRDFEELRGARDALTRDRTALLNRRRQARHRLLRRQLDGRLAQADRRIAALDREIGKLAEADAALSRRLDVLRSIPGIATVTATGLLAGMPELGDLDGAAAASLAGLAPVTRESGQWKGSSFIGGGRGKVRRTLYMAAVAAIRHNPELGRKYRALCARGKPPKVALTAVMRKLLVLANALLKQDRLWTPRSDAAVA